ncbi:MAG: tetratricopeptide repeat protein [Acidobacteria bacterium]|nr:tetratricopeptide repeat protein [Acidobacteriota bacterium]
MVRFYDRTQEWLQDKTRPVLLGLGVVAGVVALYFLGTWFFSQREAKAAVAFAQAFEKYKAPVLEPGAVANPQQTGTFYTDANQKWQETAQAFEQLANEYPGYYGAIGNYYAGVAYLRVDRDKGLQLLKKVAAKNEQPASDLAQLALAENDVVNGEAPNAIPLYEKLLKSTAVPNQVVQTGLGRAYEKTGDTEKAVAAYFEAARLARATTATSDAEKRLAALAPDKVKDLPAYDPLANATP